MDMIVMRRAQGAFGREKEGMNVLYMQIKKNEYSFISAYTQKEYLSEKKTRDCRSPSITGKFS